MLESFIIMLREGVEIALVIGIMLVVISRSQRQDLRGPVFWGLGLALLASVGAAIGLQNLPINEEAYEGVLYWTAAVFVATMMWWMHRKSKTLSKDIERRVQRAAEADPSKRRLEALGLGLFAFLMVFREGAEIVMFLSAVTIETDWALSLIGALAGTILSVVFAVLFVRGSLRINLRRFFVVTEIVLGIFIVQLLLNGYYEFSEVGMMPSTETILSMADPIVHHNILFLIAFGSVPLVFLIDWLRNRTVQRAVVQGTTEG